MEANEKAGSAIPPAQVGQTGDEPVTDPIAVAEAFETDPELAADLRDVLNHLGSFTFDVSGQAAE